MTEAIEIPPPVSRFLYLVSKFGDVLDSAQVTTLAYRAAEKWTNLTTLVKFGGPTGLETSFDVDHEMLVISEKKSIIEAASLVGNAIVSGEFQTKLRITIHLSQPTSTLLQQRAERVYFYSTPYDPGQNSATVLSLSGTLIESIIASQSNWSALEADIEKLDPPYLGLEDLAESHVGYPIGRAYNSTLYAILLVPCKIIAADIGREGKLQLTIKRDPRLRHEDVAFGIVVKPEAGIPDRHTVALSKATILREEKGLEIVELDIPIAGNAEVVVQLRARNEILDSTKLYPGISSPRLRCHGILDPKETVLEKALTSREGKRFEQAIAILLHLAGFKVEISAEMETVASDRYADILAFTPDEQTIIIGSCVFKDPGPQDVTLLAQSYISTKEAFDSKLTIIPVMFTSIPGKTVPGSLREQARGEEIRIGSREELLEALHLVRSGAGPKEVLNIFGRFLF